MANEIFTVINDWYYQMKQLMFNVNNDVFQFFSYEAKFSNCTTYELSTYHRLRNTALDHCYSTIVCH